MLYGMRLRQRSIGLLTFIKVLEKKRTDGKVLMPYAFLAQSHCHQVRTTGWVSQVEPMSRAYCSGSGLGITASPQNGPLNPQSFYKSHIDNEHVTSKSM